MMEEEINNNKPIIITEFGADTVAGQHSVSDQMLPKNINRNH